VVGFNKDLELHKATSYAKIKTSVA
jgi:hypothetical protein